MDWTFSQIAWSSLGLLVAAAGLALLIRGGVHWRTRGEKPCACGYDLAHSPIDGGTVQCAECGVKVPVARIVAKQPRRWKLVFAGMVLLLLGEPVWRVQHVTDATGTKNCMAVVPTWVLAGVWPVPHPAGNSDETRWRDIARRGTSELLARVTTYLERDTRSSIWGRVFCSRVVWLWQGTTMVDDAGESTLQVVRLPRVQNFTRAESRGWSDEAARARDAMPSRSPMNGASGDLTDWHEEQKNWEAAIAEMLLGNNTSFGFLSMPVLVTTDTPTTLDDCGESIIAISIVMKRQATTQAWSRLLEFYDLAGPARNEVLLKSVQGVDVRAYWIGDVCQSEAELGSDVGLFGRDFISELLNWTVERGARDGLMQGGIVDPTGEILVMRGDTRMHELLREFIAHLHEVQSQPKSE